MESIEMESIFRNEIVYKQIVTSFIFVSLKCYLVCVYLFWFDENKTGLKNSNQIRLVLILQVDNSIIIGYSISV